MATLGLRPLTCRCRMSTRPGFPSSLAFSRHSPSYVYSSELTTSTCNQVRPNHDHRITAVGGCARNEECKGEQPKKLSPAA